MYVICSSSQHLDNSTFLQLIPWDHFPNQHKITSTYVLWPILIPSWLELYWRSRQQPCTLQISSLLIGPSLAASQRTSSLMMKINSLAAFLRPCAALSVKNTWWQQRIIYRQTAKSRESIRLASCTSDVTSLNMKRINISLCIHLRMRTAHKSIHRQIKQHSALSLKDTHQDRSPWNPMLRSHLTPMAQRQRKL